MIAARQNEKRHLQLLAAQRQLYHGAKRVFGMQVLIAGPLSISLAFIGIFFPASKSYVALWGIFATVLELFVFNVIIKRLRDAAARVQEEFDCSLMELPWNKLKAGNRPEPELIEERSRQYRSHSASMPTLRNWYAPIVDELPLYVGRVACQRSNCWWDAKLRRRVAAWTVVVLATVVVALAWLSLGKNATTEEVLLRLAVPLLPLIILCVKHFIEQNEAVTRLDKLRDYADSLWQDALKGKSEPDMTSSSRLLQDEILESRRKAPFVFDKIFVKTRDEYEKQMKYGVEQLVNEAKSVLLRKKVD